MNKMQKTIIYELKRQGLGPSAIARELDVPVSTIASFLRRHSSPPGMIACKQCGKLVRLTPGKKKRIFCSDKCKSQWWNMQRYGDHRNLIVSTCQYCGKEFMSYASEKRKYCSAFCYHNARRNGGIQLTFDQLSRSDWDTHFSEGSK